MNPNPEYRYPFLGAGPLLTSNTNRRQNSRFSIQRIYADLLSSCTAIDLPFSNLLNVIWAPHARQLLAPFNLGLGGI